MKASDYYIGANDEHGITPPTPGKRTPAMPYLNRSIYENEFNRPSKIFFIIAALRCGFKVFDVHPETSDISIGTRVARVNAAGLTLLTTFGYNAYGTGTSFNSVRGLFVYYSPANRYYSRSRILSEDIFLSVSNNSLQTVGRSVERLTDVGVLESVNCASSLCEAGFMTNLTEGRLMLDPDWQQSIGDAATIGVCNNLQVEYIDGTNPASYPTIKQGNSGNYVKMAQYYLIRFGHVLVADGTFGANTVAATKSFQTFNGLVADGIIGKNTWAKLTLLSPQSTVLKKGKTGSEVYYMQQKLLSKLYPLTIDGVFGAGTETQVKAFQSESGLAADGIVGPLTWSKILTINSPRAQ